MSDNNHPCPPILAINLLSAIIQAGENGGPPPGHCDYLNKKQMANCAKRALVILEPLAIQERNK